MLRPGITTVLIVLLLGALTTSVYGEELTLLADLGSTSSIWGLTDIDGALFFAGTQPATGTELWLSDGSPAGTFMVQDTDPGTSHFSPAHFAELDGIALFQGSVHPLGEELWRSDGTAAGTWMVKDINIYHHSSPAYLKNYNGMVVFNAIGPDGQELYRTDGTEAGTFVLKDIEPGTGGSGPKEFTEVDGTLFFSAYTTPNGYELWKTDGTEAGTVEVKDINPTYGSNSLLLTSVGSTLYFSADVDYFERQLWKSDGTEAGTVMVKDIWPTDMVCFNGQLFLAADDGTGDVELWTSDGTDAGTVRVKNINPTGTAHVAGLVVVDETLYFQAYTYSTGRELWKSDGTEAGTAMVEDIRPGYSGSWPYAMTGYNGIVFFAADDGDTGYELWRSDGTEAGTYLVNDFEPGPDASMLSVEPTVCGGKLFFDVGLSTGAQLWKLETTAVAVAEDATPGRSAGPVLGQNHPNPFNPTTTITYVLPEASDTRLTIHDVRGNLLVTLLDGERGGGVHSITWSGRDALGQDVAAGVYYARLAANGQVRTRKLTLLK